MMVLAPVGAERKFRMEDFTTQISVDISTDVKLASIHAIREREK